jgi:pimeloyl-ACP methyl ester carboxylesterase
MSAASALEQGTIHSPLGEVVLWRSVPGPGSAPGHPLLYLHSAGGETGPMVSVWLEAMAAGGREIVMPMMPGFAGSAGITEIEVIEDLVFHLLDLLRLLDLEGERRPHVVGLSLGGWLAAELACRYPERIASLTLVNPAGLYVPGAPIAELFGIPLDELAELVFASQDHPVARAMRSLGDALRADPTAVPFDALRPFMEALAAAARVAWNPYFHNPLLRRRLHRVTVPTLVVAGEQDRLIPPVHAETYAELIPGARADHIASGAHMVPLENPQELAELVLDHIKAAEL